MRLRTAVSAAAVLAVALVVAVASLARADVPEPQASSYGLGGSILTLNLGQVAASEIDSANDYTDSAEVLNWGPSLLGSSLGASAVSSNADGVLATGASSSSAHVAGLALTVGTPPLGIPTLLGLSAGAVESSCNSDTADSIELNSTLASASLTLGGVTYPLVNAPTPNLVVNVGPLGRLVLNEQIDNGDGTWTVNAIHFVLLGSAGADIVVASSTCLKLPDEVGVPIFGG